MKTIDRVRTILLLQFLLQGVVGFVKPLCGRRFVSSTQASSVGEQDDRKWSPLLSIPIPGSKTATLQIPGPAQARYLVDLALSEARSVGVRDATSRSLQAQQAISAVIRKGLSSGEFQNVLAQSAPEIIPNLNILGRQLRATPARESTPATVAPRLLRQLFEELGATYVKLGQFIASSPTLFPPEYVVEFQQCLDRSSTIPFSTVREIIEAELGGKLEDVFESVDPTPLASASIAQVHAAVLKEPTTAAAVASGGGQGTGARRLTRDVVIKVRKPEVEATLKTDLALLTVVGNFVEALAPEASRLSIAGIATDLRDSMLGELDFRLEAQRLRTFDAFLTSQELASVATCPLPVEALTTAKVLTMTRLKGAPLLDAANAAGSGSESGSSSSYGSGSVSAAAGAADDAAAAAEAALVAALNVWCLSVTRCEFFHADVHGGNLLLLDDEEEEEEEAVAEEEELRNEDGSDEGGGGSDGGGDIVMGTSEQEEEEGEAVASGIVTPSTGTAARQRRVGFIDFGIVGTLPPSVWGAVGDMSAGFSSGDMVGVAESLVAMGVVKKSSDAEGGKRVGQEEEGKGVDVEALAKDLSSVMQSIQRTQQGGPSASGATAAATAAGAAAGAAATGRQAEGNTEGAMEVAAEVTELALDVVGAAERNGLRLPREFGLLVKQGLYFDRYLKTLAPELNPFNDPRITAFASSPGSSSSSLSSPSPSPTSP